LEVWIGYEAIVAAPGHHSAEAVCAEVRRRTPVISLATVDKNLRLFVEHGLLREVSPHASTLLVEGNLEPHYHLVCTRCKTVQDIGY
jgi:Fur family peroxide stress response transcriptional regulator